MDAKILTSAISNSNIGLILQRGGEELALRKIKDRFMICLASPQAHLPHSIVAFAHKEIPYKDGEGKALLFEEITVDSEDLEEAIEEARKSEEITFATHIYQVKGNPETLVYLTNQITVQFLPTLKQETINKFQDYFQLKLIKSVKGIDNTYIYELSKESTINPIKISNSLIASPEVITAEANIILGRESFYHPQETFYDHQWYLHHEGGRELAIGSHINVESAWDITKGSPSITIAVADDGIDIRHPDFQGEGKIVSPKDFSDQDFLPLPEHNQESHGTACAGIAVAQENGTGIIGVAPECALMPLRTNGFLDDNSIEDLFNYALEKEASVLSCSWGVSAVKFPLSLRQKVALSRLATEGRGGKGCVVVFAAGNANRPINGTIYERNWTNNLLQGTTQWLNGFASHPDVIAVSACTSLNKKSAYSNWGEEVALCAPSNNGKPMMWFEETGFIPTAPEINASLPGKGIFTTDQLENLSYDPGNFTRDFGGTSSSCPMVAGVVALMLSVNPHLTASEVKMILQETADKIMDVDADPQLGMKMGTYNSNGHSLWFGYGKVNAHKAVEVAQARIQQELITEVITQENSTQMNIPDDDPKGISSLISIEQNGTIKEVEVNLNIEHEFLGDLEISLRSPQGQMILLQNRTLGAKTSLNKEYNLYNTPALQQLIKKPITGEWTLWLVDYAKEDTGILKGWEIVFKV